MKLVWSSGAVLRRVGSGTQSRVQAFLRNQVDLVNADRTARGFRVVSAMKALRARFGYRRRRERIQRSLTPARQQLRAAVAESSTAMYICDRELRYVVANRAYLELMGFNADAPIGRRRTSVMSGALFKEQIASDQRALAGETVAQRVTVQGADKDRSLSVLKFPLSDADGDVYGICGILSQSTDHDQMQAEIEHLGQHDALTGLYNRQHLISELEGRLCQGMRGRCSGAVLLFDIDNFKVVNDTFGHAIGDEQLKSVGQALRERVRETDAVARFGSDEFAVVLADVTEAQALSVAAEIRALLYEPGIGPPIRVSIGVSMFDAPAELTAEALLVSADLALYDAKRVGGDRTVVYGPQTSGVLTWVQQIRGALANRRFVLHAQPILDLRSGEVACHELLIRMQSDDGRMIPPAAFIPPAERFGLICEIDRWVTGQALMLAADGRRVTINLSANSLTDQTIVGAVRDAVKNGLDPRNIIFEITETAAITNTADACRLARTLAGIGCELALDDFGTGFASFTYLKHFPARYLKIDTDFVRHARNDTTDQAIIRSICGVARALGKETIAEGVEDLETLEVLRRQGVDYAQGFFIGRPKPIAPTRTSDAFEQPERPCRRQASDSNETLRSLRPPPRSETG